jgi:hypothetical protein
MENSDKGHSEAVQGQNHKNIDYNQDEDDGSNTNGSNNNSLALSNNHNVSHASQISERWRTYSTTRGK